MRGRATIATSLAMLVVGAALATRAEGDVATPEVDAVIRAWLAAQNVGRFDDYRALYDEQFQGVRRSGTRTRLFDREGWLADRARMFKKSMQVDARDVKVSPDGADINVVFTQTFTSGSYKDQGTKAIVLRKRSVGWLIVREEMLSSSKEAPPTLLAPAEWEHQLLVVDRKFDNEASAKDGLREMRLAFAQEPAVRFVSNQHELGVVERLPAANPSAAAPDATWAVVVADCSTAKEADALASGLKRLGPLRRATVVRKGAGECPNPLPVAQKKVLRVKIADGTSLEARLFEPIGGTDEDLPVVSLFLEGAEHGLLDASMINGGTISDAGANTGNCYVKMTGKADQIEVRYECGGTSLSDGCMYDFLRLRFSAHVADGHVAVDLTSRDPHGHKKCAE
jgi:ketosteroid isomerase-like protein